MDPNNTTPQPTQQTTIQIPAEMRAFLEGILREADVFIADEADLQELLGTMYNQLNSLFIAAIVEKLPEDKVDGFIDLNEKGGDDPKVVQAYIEQNLPNAKDVIGKVYADFRNLYLDTLAIEDARLDAMEGTEKQSATLDVLQKLAGNKSTK